jgi:hypothetical protein
MLRAIGASWEDLEIIAPTSSAYPASLDVDLSWSFSIIDSFKTIIMQE